MLTSAGHAGLSIPENEYTQKISDIDCLDGFEKWTSSLGTPKIRDTVLPPIEVHWDTL
jgi:hypothetical protein